MLTWILVFLVTWPIAGDTFVARNNLHGTTVDNTGYSVLNLDLISYARPDHSTCFERGFHRSYHAGIDIYHKDGTAGKDALAVEAGTVAAVDDTGGLNAVILALSGGRYAVYFHIERIVNPGEVVIEGQSLGAVVAFTHDGRFPRFRPDGDDSHLHFEIRDFLDGSSLFPDWPRCPPLPVGIGYTYPELPGNFGYLRPIDGMNPIFLPLVMSDDGPVVSDQGSIPNPGFDSPLPKAVLCDLANGNFDSSTAGPNGIDPAPWIQIKTAEPPVYGMVTTSANSGPYAALLGALAPATAYEIVDEELVQSFVLNGRVSTIRVTAKLQRGDTVDADDWFAVQLKDADTQAVLTERMIDLATVGTSWTDYSTIFGVGARSGVLSISWNHVSDQDSDNSQLRVDDVAITCS